MQPAETENRKNELPAAGLLTVRALTVAYTSGKRTLVALRELSLAVAPGELVGLVGPNGCGKTTLIRAVTKVEKPVSGEVRLCDEPIGSLSQTELARRVAVVPPGTGPPEAFPSLDC